MIPWSLLNPFFLSFENEALNLGPAQLEQPHPISKKLISEEVVVFAVVDVIVAVVAVDVVVVVVAVVHGSCK